MMDPTQIFYRAYTHTNPYFTPAPDDLQAATPAALPPHPAANYPQQIASQKASLNQDFLSKLNSTSTLNQGDIDELATGYILAWSSIYKNPAVITRILKDTDSTVTTFYGDGQQANAGWGGSFYQIADAVKLVYDQLAPHLDETVDYGVGGTLARRKAWSAAFRADVDQSRFNRKTIANQAFTVDYGLYLSNKAIELIDPSNALPEDQAQEYLMQTCGLEYYKGSDLPGGGSAYEDGPNYYMVTPKGNSRERGWVGSDYGLYPTVMTARFYLATGNRVFLDRALTILKARAHFEYPSTDGSLGSGAGYYSMVVSDEINTRNEYYPGRPYYTDLITAALTLDPQAVGYVQQAIADNEFLSGIGNPSVVDLATYYPLIAAQPPSSYQLPLTDGQPDSAWADEDDQVVAVKHGDERLFANLFFNSNAIDGEVRVYLTGAQAEHYADVRVDDEVYADSGTWTTGIADVDANGGATEDLPPDNPTSANYGVHFPNSTAFGGPGRAAAYTFRFGSYLVGMNSSDDPNYVYSVKLPPGFTRGYDLISGQTLAAPIFLKAKTSAVFYYTDPAGSPRPLPSRPVFFTVVAGNAQVALGWDAPAGAEKFNVRRATASGGPYTTVASGLSDPTYSDRSVVNGITYFYVVTGVNATGEGAVSGERSAMPSDSQQAFPWGYATVSTNPAFHGSAKFTAPDAVTVTTSSYGFNNDVFHRSDDFSYVSQTLAGDGSLTARLTSISAGNANECGIDFRGTLAANDASASVAFYGNGTVSLGVRADVNAVAGTSVLAQNLTLPYWLSLVRSGMTFTAFGSMDGKKWTTLGELTVPAMSNSTYMGLGAGRSASCVFDNISATQLLTSTSNTTAIAVSAEPQPNYYAGDTLNLMANVSRTSQTPLTGLVTFYDGATAIGTATPGTNTEAALPSSSLTVGTHSITATYTGDTVLQSSRSAAVPVHVLAAPDAQLMLTSSSNPAVKGTTITFTLSSVGGQAAGSVNFYDGTTLIASGGLINGNGIVTTSTNKLAAGTHQITATFASESIYASQTSPVLNQIVTNVPKTPSSVALTVAPGPSVPAKTVVTLTAKVTSSTSNAGVAFRSVLFYDTASNPSFVGLAGVNSAGVATYKTVLGVGTHTLQAVFLGTPDLFGTTSTTQTLVVVPAAVYTTAGTLTSSAPSASLQAPPLVTAPGTTFTDQLSFYGQTAPTGTVQFKDTTTGTVLGSIKPGALTQTFALPTTFASGAASTGALESATGDFNKDGYPDIAVTNLIEGTVGILLGNGDGTFKPQKSYAAGAAPYGVVVNDFNGDGFLDLAVTNLSANTVSVLLGKGDGSFGTAVAYSTGAEPYGIVAGDFNSDGIEDLAVTNLNDNTVSLLLGKGDGTFQPQKVVKVGTNPFALVAADLNGDGNLDLGVVNGSDNTVSELLGNGDGTFQPQVRLATGAVPYSIAAGDFNGDGKADLAVANLGAHTVSVLLNAGSGAFSPQVTYPTGSEPIYLAAINFDGSGKQSLAVANSTGNSISVLQGVGDGTFQPQAAMASTTGAAPPYFFSVADFNGDGKQDLAATTFGGNVVGVQLGLQTGVATLTGVTLTGSGKHTVTATYLSGPSDAYAPSTANPLTLTIAAKTALTLTSSQNPVVAGASITFTATATGMPPGRTAGAQVSFFDTAPGGAGYLGTVPLDAAMAAKYTTAKLKKGKHTITAVVSGSSMESLRVMLAETVK